MRGLRWAVAMVLTVPARASAHAGFAALRRNPVARTSVSQSSVAADGTSTDVTDPVLASTVSRTVGSAAVAGAAPEAATNTKPRSTTTDRHTDHGIAVAGRRDRGLTARPAGRAPRRIR